MKPEHEIIVKNCQKSVTWFLRNFGVVKHPTMGALRFNPYHYQQKALRTFRDNRFVIFRKCRQCFAEDQMVWTPTGPKRIDSIKAGDIVYSYNKDNGLLETRPVQQVYSNGESECVEVRSKTGHRSICTSDHKFFTESGEIQAGLLTSNDVLLEVSEPQKYGASVDESEVILLGYLLTDGHYRKGINFTNTNWKYLLEYQKHYQKRFGGRARIKYHGRGQNGKGKRAYRITTNRTIIKKWLQSLGIYGHARGSKEIPECVFRWNNKSIALLLNRMFAADGWYSFSNCNEVGIGQLSVKMIHQIKQLLSRFGISAKIYPSTGDKLTRLRILGGPDFSKFVEYIGIFDKEPRAAITKGFFFNRKKGSILSVKPVNGIKKVYDLKVGPHDNYIVDGAVVHNCGISKISGAYALWYAMFYPMRTVLIVSRADVDAMTFLEDNIKFLFKHLPQWMQDYWAPVKDNDHEIKFSNGSTIRSKTSHPDVMRSNASSLNIIDEAAFIPQMGNMWSSAWSTMQTGGSAIVVSTAKGVGNWYWSTYTDAQAGLNTFVPLDIMWWDMDWVLEYDDPLSGKHVRIAPRDGIRPCTPDECEIYGPYWSPWLEEQFKNLQEKGELWKFKQEILAEFVGSGNTIIESAALQTVSDTVSDEFNVLSAPQHYVHPVSNEPMVVDFTTKGVGEGLRIWDKPVHGIPAKTRGKTIIEPGVEPYTYVAGLDLATGKGADYHALQMLCLETRSQVAELMMHCKPRELKYIVDYICRYYNNALLVVERNNGGDHFIDEMRLELNYPRLWRKKVVTNNSSRTSVSYGEYGFFTGPAGKPILNRYLLDYVRANQEEGFKIKSRRLHKQMLTYVRKKDQAGNDTNRTEAESGPGNHDDLVIALALAFVGLSDAGGDHSILMPMRANPDFIKGGVDLANIDTLASTGNGYAFPFRGQTNNADDADRNAIQDIAKFCAELGGLIGLDRSNLPASKTKRKYFDK